jgi:integrase
VGLDHPENPARLASPPVVEKAKVRPPEVGQVAELLRVAMQEDVAFGLFLRLAVVLGARRGELCALRWSHIDFERGEILVAGSVIYVPGQPLIDKDTKTHAERRWRSAPTPWRHSAPIGFGPQRQLLPPVSPSGRTPMCSPTPRTARRRFGRTT